MGSLSNSPNATRYPAEAHKVPIYILFMDIHYVATQLPFTAAYIALFVVS